ncbi:MAG: cell division protein FtsZ, partial [Thermodesulfobacteriota bacterium]|nr:cell division protein FtsZ [Thermodesulfobacteriota bacterium]
ARVKVIGAGGGGCNAINNMILAQLEGVEFLAANTDIQSLQYSQASTKITMGKRITKGLGTGGNPEIGKKCAQEEAETIKDLISETDMVFITAGMGGGTGTGSSPIIANIAKENGSLTVAIVTKPFNFEGRRRQKIAEKGIEELEKAVDTLITIPNERLITISDKNTSLKDAFKMADNVLLNAVKGISELISLPALINLDFQDVKTIMSEMGMAFMGIGQAKGENRAIEAAKMAITSPLLDDISIDGALGILINIAGGSNLGIHEINEASTIIQERAHEDANIIFGARIDENLGEEIKVTVIATGFGTNKNNQFESNFATQDIKTRVKEDIELPAFIRKNMNEKNKLPKDRVVYKLNKTIDENLSLFEENDIPAFIRKNGSEKKEALKSI